MNKGRRHWTDRQNTRLRLLWSTSITAKDIGESLGGFSEAAVLHHAKDIGLDRRLGLSQPKSFLWTDERIAELKRLDSEGYSGAEIGKAFGITRNAVIGKLDRAKNPSRPTDRRKAPQKAKIIARRVAKVKVPKPVPVAPEAPQSPPVTMMELRPFGACKFPVGTATGAGQMFCGAKADGVWCPHHRLIVWLPKPTDTRTKRKPVPSYRQLGAAL